MNTNKVWIVHVLIDGERAKVIEHKATEQEARTRALLVHGAGHDGPYEQERFPIGTVVTAEDLES